MFESKFSAVSKGCTCVNKVKQLHYTRNVAPDVPEVKKKTCTQFRSAPCKEMGDLNHWLSKYQS